jgi:hypothetical protein
MRAESLGALLTKRGHITDEQLELALTEQKATGRPLGEIIVARGFASGPTVAQALATQHGGLLKTEYGFATGWSGRGPGPKAVLAGPRQDEVERLRASLLEHQQALAAWQQSHAALEESIARLETGRDELRHAFAKEVERAAALRAELLELQCRRWESNPHSPKGTGF